MKYAGIGGKSTAGIGASGAGSELDYEAISQRCREDAKRYAEKMYPPDMPRERERAEEEAYLRFYRQRTGADRPRIELR